MDGVTDSLEFTRLFFIVLGDSNLLHWERGGSRIPRPEGRG